MKKIDFKDLLEKISTCFHTSNGDVDLKKTGVAAAIIITMIIMLSILFSPGSTNVEHYRNTSVNEDGQVVTSSTSSASSETQEDPVIVKRTSSVSPSESDEPKRPFERNPYLKKGGFIGNKVSGNDIFLDSQMNNIFKASDTILFSDKKSGTVQVANLIFTLPCTLDSLVEHGVSVISIGSDVSMETSTRALLKGSTQSCVLYYRGCTFVASIANYSEVDTDIKNGYVYYIREDASQALMESNVNHVYSSGGLSKGASIEDLYSSLKEPDFESSPFPGTNSYQVVYGEKVYFPRKNDTNYIGFDFSDGIVGGITIYCNYFDTNAHKFSDDSVDDDSVSDDSVSDDSVSNK